MAKKGSWLLDVKEKRAFLLAPALPGDAHFTVAVESKLTGARVGFNSRSRLKCASELGVIR